MAKPQKEERGELVKILKIISEKNRFLILQLLQERDMFVCEIWKCLDLPQNLASHHLKTLKKIDLIKSRREGSKVVYSLNKKNVKKMKALFSRFIK